MEALTLLAKLKDRSFTMASGLEGIGLDATHYRNLGGIINHSKAANAESQCIFERGAEQAIITAKTTILKGHQILIDYSKNYWTKKVAKEKKLQDLTYVPPLSLK